MAVFLVGCLWYLIGIGDAAIYRQKMQDGSDSVAFASAVYHARGMNIIAMLNLIMAAVLAVLVALKIAEILVWTVVGVATALCFFGVGCPVIEPATDLGLKLSFEIIPRVRDWVDTILRVLSKSQTVVAKATPWVGTVRGVAMSLNYGPVVKGGLGLSISMLPHDKRIGLPVQDEPFEKLCFRAGKLVGTIGFGWIPGGDLIAGTIGAVTSSFPQYFCGGSSMTSVREEAKRQAKSQCEEAKKSFEAKPENKGAPFDIEGCRSSAENIEIQQGIAENGGSQFDGNDKRAKELYYKAKNGDEYFQVYGFVMGDNEAMHGNDKRVETAAWDRARVETGKIENLLEKISFSQAEFYFDQVERGKLEWDKYKDDALWNMRWRARLRRFRLPTSNVGAGLLQNGIPSWVPGIPEKYKTKGLDWLSTRVSESLGDNWVSVWINDKIGEAFGPVKVLDSKVSQFVGGLTDPVIVH
ncbi:MAG: hypothetical protein QM820_55790 [Minicystis sp.]